ncbi:hypothetical protein [Altererythrobacter sp. ZODW24]|uniref:hypothetical protein n=1 Tax=Altererythrobacter sp. ZODW24 TaxID=2185142 RepID=UPI001F082C5B|nr:hypothetical protein [Altererythrobacter sp. ZODW24]
MPSFFLTLLAVVLTSTGARDQLLMARLSEKLGGSGGLLLVAWISAIASAAVMAFAGSTIADFLPPSGKLMLAAFALILAGGELAWNRKTKQPAEPTRSLFAIFIVLLARQIGDGARFLVFALAIATGSALLAGVGGAVGGGIAVTLGWAMGEDATSKLPLRAIRIGLAILVLTAGLYTAINARGLIA